MRWAWYVARMEGGEVQTWFWWVNLWERGHLVDPGLDGRVILNWIFKNWDGDPWPNCCGSGLGQAVVIAALNLRVPYIAWNFLTRTGLSIWRPCLALTTVLQAVVLSVWCGIDLRRTYVGRFVAF